MQDNKKETDKKEELVLKNPWGVGKTTRVKQSNLLDVRSVSRKLSNIVLGQKVILA